MSTEQLYVVLDFGFDGLVTLSTVVTLNTPFLGKSSWFKFTITKCVLFVNLLKIIKLFS